MRPRIRQRSPRPSAIKTLHTSTTLPIASLSVESSYSPPCLVMRKVRENRLTGGAAPLLLVYRLKPNATYFLRRAHRRSSLPTRERSSPFPNLPAIRGTLPFAAWQLGLLNAFHHLIEDSFGR